MALGALFSLGAFLGKVSSQNLFVSGLKMITAGLVSILLSYLLEST
jgi:VIT1/CCC1 family predicted Fe2+/Mn2+ transporter